MKRDKGIKKIKEIKEKYSKMQILSIVPTKRALWKLALPAIIGMMVNALYNIIDTIFIGQGIGSLAIGGLSIVFPLQMVLNSIAIMIGVGAASIISRSLGQGNNEKASNVAANAMLYIIIFGVIAIIFGMIYINELLLLLGATEGNFAYAYDYLTIILYGCIFGMFSAGCNNIIRAEGKAITAMVSMLLGLGVNIVLDPIFIFALNLGVRGAAIATIISQLLSSLFVVGYLIFGKSIFKFTLRNFIPRLRILVDIIYVGLPNFVRQAGISVLAIVLNNLLFNYGGDVAISTYGVINKLTMFLIFPTLGIMQGMQPIFGYSYGAKNYHRSIDVLRYATIYGTLYMFVVWALIEIFAKYSIMMFTTDAAVVAMGTKAIRIVVAVFPVVIINMVSSTTYQSLGFGIRALFLALIRQTILLLPLILLLPKALGIMGIWWAFPISDFSASVISGFMIVYELKRFAKLQKQKNKEELLCKPQNQ
ncbi:MAG: MATE family efflux transporter [Clostridia bacterium]